MEQNNEIKWGATDKDGNIEKVESTNYISREPLPGDGNIQSYIPAPIYGPSKHNPPGQEELLRKSMEAMKEDTQKVIDSIWQGSEKTGNGIWEKLKETDLGKQPYQQVMDVLVNDQKVRVTTIAHKDTPEETIAALIGEQKNLEAKVLQWYLDTRDEKYRHHMGITVTRTGNDNQSNNDPL